MKEHKHYNLCYNAHRGTSFTPEKRAESYCKMYDEDLKKAIDLGGSTERFEKLFINWMNAKSRCLSVMIAGGSNFPVRRAEKANESERNHGTVYFEYFDKLKSKNDRVKRGEVIIKSSDDDAVEKLQSKLDVLVKSQELMKEVNRINRSKKSLEDKTKLLKDIGIKDENIDGMLGSCFESYALTNNNAKIKATQQRLEIIKKTKSQETKETAYNGFVVVNNTDEMRIQFIFEEKPSDEIRKVLKSNAFKWSPTNEAWQRQITNNATYTTNKFVIPSIKELLQ